MAPNHIHIFANITVDDLLSESPFLSKFINDGTAKKTFSMDSIAYLQEDRNSFNMSTKKPDIANIKSSRGKLKYWQPVKKEFILLLCTDDPKYIDLRRKIKSIETPVTAYIAVHIGAAIGVKPAEIIGFCAICLYFVVQIHKEAFCSELKKCL